LSEEKKRAKLLKRLPLTEGGGTDDLQGGKGGDDFGGGGGTRSGWEKPRVKGGWDLGDNDLFVDGGGKVITLEKKTKTAST